MTLADKLFEIQEFLTIKRHSHFSSYLIGKYYKRHYEKFLKSRRLDHLIKIERKLNDSAAVSIDKIIGKVIIINIKQENYFIAYEHPCGNKFLY